MAVFPLVVGVHEVDGVEKEDGAGDIRDAVVPEEEVFGKQDGAGFNWVYGVSQKDVFRKQDGALRIRIRWPQECQPFGLVDEKGGTKSVSYVEFRDAADVTIAGEVPDEDEVVKQDDACCI